MASLLSTVRRDALSAWRRTWVVALGAGALACVAFALEARSRPDLACEGLYLAAVALVAWFVPGVWSRAAFAASLAALHVTAGFLRSPWPMPTGRPLAWHVGTHLAVFLALAWLVSSLHGAMKAQADAAATDDLTGVTSRRRFLHLVSEELTSLHESGRPHGVAFIDLDRFRDVNNLFGHARGDEVLAACARAIRGAVDAGDVVGRIGGDEFAVLLRCDDLAALRTAERIREAVLAAAEAQGLGSVVGASVGVVTCHLARPAPHRLLAAADALMYRAKAKGGHSIAFEALTEDTDAAGRGA